MVTSGLSERTDVSHLRLSVHLGCALFILGGLIWTALDLLRGRAVVTGVAAIALLGLAAQVVVGAWVAGMNAGQVAATWPTMNGRFFPEGVTWVGPTTFVDDPFLVHFVHRWWAFLVVGLLVWLARRARAAGDRAASVAVHSAFGLQVLLGIWTVLAGVPIWLGVLHQAIGALVVATSVWAAHAVGLRYQSTTD
jgi:cytochrome c oxidase assembly protein subunit 15